MSRGDVDPELDAWMAAGAGAGAPCHTRHETPAARIYVFDHRVLKLKKPVDFGFLDFSTLEKRAWAIRRELEFNRRTAPDVYRAVHAITRDAAGFRLGGPGEAVEWTLEMRPFDADALLAERPERLDGELAERLGRTVADVQASAPLARAGRGAAGLDYVIGSNAEQLRSLAPELGEEAVERLISATRVRFEALSARLDARRDAGFVRRCHGDLHLGNIVVEDRRPVLFDCIEFSDALSEIDVLYDTAFLLMDLTFRGQAAAANRVLNAWADQAGRSFGPDRLAGLAALPLFQAVRAAVRAHVSGHGGDLDRARRYLAAAERHLDVPPRRLVAVGGLSGTGKSTVARALATLTRPSPGALVVRSDEVRKRLWGVGAAERLPKAAYTPEAGERVYAAMTEAAGAALRAGWPVLLDATFLTAAARGAAQALATELDVPFLGLWLEAPPQVLRERLRARRGDASDADERVLEAQLAVGVGEVRWRRIDAAASMDDQLAAAMQDG